MLSRQLLHNSISTSLRRLALKVMNFGNIFLPLTLVAAAIWEPAKYFMSVPATAVTVALIIGAYSACHELRE
jgi:hypothetical protein